MQDDTQEIFIRQYNSAYESGMTLKQFADFLEIKPKSVQRRRQRIKNDLGLDLPLLPHDNGGVDVELPEDWKTVLLESKYNIIDESDKGSRKIVITCAQNATPVFKPFLQSLEKYCEYNNAKLYVIPSRYKNPTSVFTKVQKDDEWWDINVEKYLETNYVQVCKGLQIMGHIKIQPTAVNPLSGFDSHTGLNSAVFAHPKIQLKTIPTPSQHLPKILTTTGSVTKENYTDSKAGHKGHFHHSYGAVVVDITEEEFHIRHVHGNHKDGSFYDLDKKYTPKEVIENQEIEALVTGDSHAYFIDELVEKATYSDPDSIKNVLKPKYLVYHDIEDFYPRNHHHKNNHILLFSKHHLGKNNVEEGLQITADFIDRNSSDNTINILVKSNHDEALDRWLKEADPKIDPENSKFYHYMIYKLLDTVQETDTGFSHDDPFELWCREPMDKDGLKNYDKTKFLSRDESFTIKNIEVGFHGDKGPNGARGSVNNFSKIGVKTIIGHSHSPAIQEGAYCVGLSAKMNLEYVSGPSSWLQTHCIIYPDGKRTLINIINGRWKG